MASLLHRIGRGSVRHRRIVLVVWLVVLFGVGALAASFSAPTSDAFSIPGTESQRAMDLLAERFPDRPDGASTMVVFAAPEGGDLESDEVRAGIATAVENLEAAPQVVEVTDPMLTLLMPGVDGDVAFASVTYDASMMDVESSTLEAIQDAVEPAEAAGLQVEFGGEVYPGGEVDIGGLSEALGLLIAIVVLLITFGSLVAAGLPIITALIGVGTGIAGITALSGVIDLSSTAPTLATMIGLAVGIDYALFIVSRHRQNLAAGMTPEDAAAGAVATAGSAVMFAAATVIVALCGLSVVNIPFLTVMALAAAGTVFIAGLIAVTLLPALLGFAGHTIDRGRIPGLKLHRAANSADGFGTRWARGVLRRPRTVVVAVVVAVGIVALPALSIDLGLPGQDTAPTSSTQRKAYDLITRGFGPGFNGMFTIVVDADGIDDPEAVAATVTEWLGSADGIDAVLPAEFNATGDTAVFAAIPSTGPSDAATTDLIHHLRDEIDTLETETGAGIEVTGTTALTIDVSDKLGQALPTFLVVVVGLALLILLLAFRSILVPIKAAVGFLFTIAASFGAVVAVFQWGWLKDLFGVETTGPIVSFLPILLMAVLFGLAMDYEVFLVSRMREEVDHGAAPREAIIAGFTGGARVVTAAALIMTSVFGAFMLGDDAIIKSMGFALAFGVLVDAFVVRMTLVPAVMALFGKAAWWLPSWLERIIPKIDLEGESFNAEDPDAGPEPEPAEPERTPVAP